MTKILILGILYSAAERVIVVTKLVILSISFLTSFVLALRETLVANLVILCISLLAWFILALRETLVAKLAFFLTPSFFTASLS